MGEKRRSNFLLVKCGECGNEQLVYSHASTAVRCQVCSKTISTPRGGKAEIKAPILGIEE